MPVRKPRIVCLAGALLLLRLVIGLHFFGEGWSKVQSGTFDCGPFLSQAQGPFAPFFRGLTDDPKGHLRLAVAPGETERVDPERHLAFWHDHLERVVREFRLDEQRQREARRKYGEHAAGLREFFEDNRLEMEAWLNDRRVAGPREDDSPGSRARLEVAGLRDQMSQIDAARRAAAANWFGNIEAIWDNYEAAMKEFADGARPLPLPRPWQPAGSARQWINRTLPWFDLTVGVLLVIGLATPLAAIGGMALLLGVVATQPFWVPGAENTFPQWIELSALGVIAAAGAGRYGGLDWFWYRPRRTFTEETHSE